MKRTLLTCGVVAGPLFLTVWAAQAFTRAGFDPHRHPPSLLALGDLGAIQIANFVVTGALYIACAIGLRDQLRGRTTWGPRLVGALGLGLIIGGVFTTDAGAGYPIGAPEGAPESLSLHAIVHEFGFLLAVGGMLAGTLVFARHFRRTGEKSWRYTALATFAASVALVAYPSPDGFALRMVASTAVLLAFVTALALRSITPLAARRDRESTDTLAHAH